MIDATLSQFDLLGQKLSQFMVVLERLLLNLLAREDKAIHNIQEVKFLLRSRSAGQRLIHKIMVDLGPRVHENRSHLDLDDRFRHLEILLEPSGDQPSCFQPFDINLHSVMVRQVAPKLWSEVRRAF
ncbi:hypothetical protein VTN77DRAFT_5984 [Rasamsonia byssochlamydoides]|uniref:uncharacterized protein n=1 Tax=Rasamsonia byssochlamydoides TaxID=89139 RepID=UPI0037438460